MYSFGVCLWEIYCCDLPYPDLSFADISSAVVRQVNSIHTYSEKLINLSLEVNAPSLTRADSLPEPTAGHPPMLPELAGEHHETVLGRESGEAAGDGRGGEVARVDRHEPRRRHDPGGSSRRVFLLCSDEGTMMMFFSHILRKLSTNSQLFILVCD